MSCNSQTSKSEVRTGSVAKDFAGFNKFHIYQIVHWQCRWGWLGCHLAADSVSVIWQGHDAASPSPRPHALEVFLFIKLAFRQGKCASFLPNGHDFHSYCSHTYIWTNVKNMMMIHPWRSWQPDGSHTIMSPQVVCWSRLTALCEQADCDPL